MEYKSGELASQNHGGDYCFLVRVARHRLFWALRINEKGRSECLRTSRMSSLSDSKDVVLQSISRLDLDICKIFVSRGWSVFGYGVGVARSRHWK